MRVVCLALCLRARRLRRLRPERRFRRDRPERVPLQRPHQHRDDRQRRRRRRALRRDWLADALQAHDMCGERLCRRHAALCAGRQRAVRQWRRHRLCRALPVIQQRRRRPGDRVGGRQRHRRDLGGGAVVLGRLGPADVGVLALRIGADHQQVARSPPRACARRRPGSRRRRRPCNSTVCPFSPPSRTRAEPRAMPSTSCAVL